MAMNALPFSSPISTAISPDERFVAVHRALGREDNSWDVEAMPLAGGPLIPLCSGWCDVDWSRDGKAIYFYWRLATGNADQRTYMIPLAPGSDLPKIPSGGFKSESELRKVATNVLHVTVSPGPTSSSYCFSEGTSHLNLYRVPLE